MNTVLLTGGAGYIGSHISRELLKEDYNVIIVDDLSSGRKDFIPSGVEFFEGDFSDTRILEKINSENKPDVVMHMAANISVEESMKNPSLYLQTNLYKSMELLNFMVKKKIRNVVFSSTGMVYSNPKKFPITEEEKTMPSNAYGMTKLMFENALEYYRNMHGINFFSLRYFNASGADKSGLIGECHKPETHLIPLVLDVALGRRKEIKIYGTDYDTKDGTCMRDYIHVLDIAKAHIICSSALINGKKGGFYNVGSGSGHTVREIIEVCREVTGHKIPEAIAPRREGDPPIMVTSHDKISREFGWKPENSDINNIIKTAWEWHKKSN